MRTPAFIYLLGIAALCSAAPEAGAEISRQDAREVFAALHAAYDGELRARDEFLHLNSAPAGIDWLDYPHVHASYARHSSRDASGRVLVHHEVSLFGGMIELPGMTRDSAALILCHEMGHGLGGAPFKDATHVSERMSVEGQADFYAASVCLPRVLPLLSPDSRPVPPDPARLALEESACANETCARSLRAAEGFRALLERVWGARGRTRWEDREPAEAASVDTRPAHYPSAQCRLDTLVNGALGRERPACWFTGP